jgi:hypothetical protein
MLPKYQIVTEMDPMGLQVAVNQELERAEKRGETVTFLGPPIILPTSPGNDYPILVQAFILETMELY